MDFCITPEWVAGLRRDVQEWDLRVKDGRLKQLKWPRMTPPLKYTGSSAELGPGGRQRRASTGMAMGSGRHPPSEVFNWKFVRRVAMQMRLPVHVWAILSRGRESEAQDGDCGFRVKGVRCRLRWREWDGERGKEWRDGWGDPPVQQWTDWHVQRMEWTKRDGVWHGEWKWEEYDRHKEWHEVRQDQRDWETLMASSAPWGSVPQEVLLGVVHYVDFGNRARAEALSAAGLVCRAWSAICATVTSNEIRVRSSRVKELIDDLSKPGSRIAQYIKNLEIRGPIPWTALSTLLKLLPRLKYLEMSGQDAASHAAFHPMNSHMFRVTSIASPATLTLTTLYLDNQWFSSTFDVLRLLASFPYLLRAYIINCNFQTASPTAPLIRCTRLQSLLLLLDETRIYHTAISSLAQWWRWPHSSADPDIPAYPGVHSADGLVAFEIMRSIPFEMLECTSVQMSLEKSWRTGLGVLYTHAFSKMGISITTELHAAYGPAGSIANARGVERGARVEHIVIRLDTDRGVPDSKILESIAAPMASLPSLRTVTLETPDPHVPAVLAGSLQRFHAMGKLRLRTCREAQQVAQAVMQNRSSYSEEQGAVSPMWYSEDRQLKYARDEWLKIIAKEEDRRKTQSVKATADAVANAAQTEASTEGGESAAPAQGSVDSDAPSPDSSSNSNAAAEVSDSSSKSVDPPEPLPTLSTSGYLFRV